MKLIYPALFLSLVPLLGFADIMPVQYAGKSITPVGKTPIRMVSAKVDIVWDEPATLTAIFIMENPSFTPSDIQLGFPVSTQDPKPERLGFTIQFDDITAPSSQITQVSNPDQFREDTWFRCQHIFAPGDTKVTVTTRLPPSYVFHAAYQEALHYCIETGGFWQGNIGSEEVNIHFPDAISPEMIVAGAPDGFSVERNIVHWKFTDFKPLHEDHDISLTYYRPDVARVLTVLRYHLAHDPQNVEIQLRLIRHLMVLGEIYSNLRYQYIGPQFQEVLAQFEKDADRKLFESLYRKLDNGVYQIKSFLPSPEFTAVQKLMNGDTFMWQSPPFVEARSMFFQIFNKTQNRTADVWKVGLAENGELFGQDRRWQSTANSAKWLTLTKQAFKAYPSDPIIKLEYKLSQLTGPDGGTINPDNGAMAEKLSEQIRSASAQDPVLKLGYND